MITVNVLPAYAGMIPSTTMSSSNRTSAPRVCGDDPGRVFTGLKRRVCSPRMRG